VIHYRTFLNSDPPRLAELWRACTQYRSLLQPMTAGMYEALVFNKPYFDRAGLNIAEDEQGLLGFSHAGFGPSEDAATLDLDLGVTSLLLLHPRADAAVGDELLNRAEVYLRSRGAKVLYGGSLRPLNPFYLGLYGGSELPGILDSDAALQRFYLGHGYREIDRVFVFRKQVSDYRALMDRRMMQIRRKIQIAIVEEPPAKSWWDACTQGEFERRQFQLLDHQMGKTLAVASLRNLDPPHAGIATGGCGLMELWVDPAHRREGYAAYLLNEVLRYLQEMGYVQLEAQTMQANAAAIAFYLKLGFVQADAGSVFRKE